MQTIDRAGVGVNCRSCGEVVRFGQPFCGTCGALQPPQPEVSYFDIFALDPKLDLDLKALEKRFYQASRKLHPDAYARAPQEEQQWSLVQTSLLNDAYRTLKQPIERTKYLLQLEGVQFEEDRQQGSAPLNPLKAPADLLEEIFELNMQLEELRANKKMGEDDRQLRSDLERSLERSKEQFVDRLGALDQELRRLWSAWDEAFDQEDQAKKTAAKEAMTALLQRRSYLQNLLRDVNETLGES